MKILNKLPLILIALGVSVSIPISGLIEGISQWRSIDSDGKLLGNPLYPDISIQENNIIFVRKLSKTFHFNRMAHNYQGGSIEFPEGIIFKVPEGSIITPEHHPRHQDLTIDISIAYDKIREAYIFTFGPSGTRFSKPAEIWIKNGLLKIENPQIFFINESGKYIPQKSESFKFENEVLKFKIYHFSRYAIASE